MATRKSPVELAHELCQVMLDIQKFISVNKSYMSRLNREVNCRGWMFRPDRLDKIKDELHLREKQIDALEARLSAILNNFQNITRTEAAILDEYWKDLRQAKRAYDVRAREIRNYLP